MVKTGRNDSCHCGSGKKYKKCCLNKPSVKNISPPNFSVPPEVMKTFYAQMAKQQKEEKEHIQKHGHIKQDIGVRGFHGYDFVASGNSMIFGKWKCYSDFLIDFLPNVLEKNWCREEVNKPVEDQHPIIQFFSLAMQAKKFQKPNADGFYEATAPLAAYLNIAYHLHLVKHNGRLDSELLRRLKHPDLFQGARHELFAEATCLRAGFSIVHENEKDGNTKHAEFVAIHKETKEKISVEAKSRHRPGVLGQAGDVQPDEEISLRFGGLLNDAINKKPPHPLAVFLDTNLPPATVKRFYEPQSTSPMIPPKLMIQLLERIRKEHGGKDPINLVIFTNHPHHYAKATDSDPQKNMAFVLSQVPTKQTENQQTFLSLYDAANKYGTIPHELPDAG